MSDQHSTPSDAADHETAKTQGGGALDGDDFTAEMDGGEAEADDTSGATGGGRVAGE